jgi:hypothetical protein
MATTNVKIEKYDVFFATTADSGPQDGSIWHNHAVIQCSGSGTSMKIYFPSAGANAQPTTNADLSYGSVIQPIEALSATLALLASGRTLYMYLNNGNANFNALSTFKI